MPVAARSRSATAVTMQAFLPPISATQGRGKRPAWSERMICMPTSCEPVKVTPAVSGCPINAAPTAVLEPLT